MKNAFLSHIRVFVYISLVLGMFLLFSAPTHAAANLVPDGDMEAADMSQWRHWGNAELVLREKTDAISVDGTQSLHVDTITHGIGGGVQSIDSFVDKINVTAGATYRFTFDYYIVDATRVRTGLGIKNSNGDFEGKMTQYTNGYGEWQRHEREFTVPADFVKDFRFWITGRQADFYIDNVSIVEIAPAPVPEEPEIPNPEPEAPIIVETFPTAAADDINDALPIADQSNNLVPDGSMELDDLSQWRHWGREDIVQFQKTSVSKREGSQSLYTDSKHVGAGFQHFYQHGDPIEVEAGKTYRFSFDYRLASGKFSARLGIKSSNSDFENSAPFFQTADDVWKSYEREFTIPEDFVKDFRISFVGKEGIFYIDNVQIIDLTPAPEPEPLPEPEPEVPAEEPAAQSGGTSSGVSAHQRMRMEAQPNVPQNTAPIISIPKPVSQEVVTDGVGGPDEERMEIPTCEVMTARIYKNIDTGKYVFVTPDCTVRTFLHKDHAHTYTPTIGAAVEMTDEILRTLPAHDIPFMPWGPGIEIEDGALVKTVHVPDVFYIKNGHKYLIQTEETYLRLFKDWSKILDVDNRVIERFDYHGILEEEMV